MTVGSKEMVMDQYRMTEGEFNMILELVESRVAILDNESDSDDFFLAGRSNRAGNREDDLTIEWSNALRKLEEMRVE